MQVTVKHCRLLIQATKYFNFDSIYFYLSNHGKKINVFTSYLFHRLSSRLHIKFYNKEVNI